MIPAALLAVPVRPIAVGVLVLLFAVWLVWLLRLATGGRSESLPSNLKPYFTDDELENKKVVRVGVIGLITSVGMAAVAAAYWLFLPMVQADWEDKFVRESVIRGARLFATTENGGLNCAGCHGGGRGGQVEFVLTSGPLRGTRVNWEAPALDDVYYRFTREEVKRILVYGRAGTPMPAWGIVGGGGQTDQEIEDLLNYMKFLEVAPDEARGRAGTDAQGQRILDGQALYLRNCARCHTPGYSITRPEARADLPQGIGAYGPSLLNAVGQFPDIDAHIAFIEQGSVAERPYGLTGVGDGRMPGFARDPEAPLLDEEQIQAIAEYERALADLYDVTAPTFFEMTESIDSVPADGGGG